MPIHSQPVLPVSHSRSSSPEIVLSVNTTPSKLVKAARRYQLERNLALSDSRAARRKLVDITNQPEEGSGSESPPPKRTRTDSNESDDEAGNNGNPAVNAGRIFVMLYSPWLRLGEGAFKVEYDPDISDAQRFKDDKSKAQGQLRDIIEVLGPQLSQEMASEAWIRKSFMKGMNSQRSNTATRLRHHCASLFNASDADMLRADIRRDRFRDQIGWVVNDQGFGTYSSVDVPIIHKDYQGKYDINTAFLNPVLMWVFVAIIRGPTAAKEVMNGLASNPRTDTMARKHGIRSTSPGAIAGAAVLARWTLSSDDFLQPVGNNTGINYRLDFEHYLELLLKGLREKKKSTLNVFREWDKVVFPHSDSSSVGDPQGISSEMKAAMEMLDADETEVEEEEDEEDELNEEGDELAEEEDTQMENQSQA